MYYSNSFGRVIRDNIGYSVVRNVLIVAHEGQNTACLVFYNMTCSIIFGTFLKQKKANNGLFMSAINTQP